MQHYMAQGNLTADGRAVTFQNGNKIVNGRLAINKRWTNRETGERGEKTTYVNLTVRYGLADVAERFWKKGQSVLIQGEISGASHYTTAEGEVRSSVEVDVTSFKMLTFAEDTGVGESQAQNSTVADLEDIPF